MLTPADRRAIREDRRFMGRHSHRPLRDQDDVHIRDDVRDDFGNPIPSLASAFEHRALAMLQRANENRLRRAGRTG